MLKGEDVMNCLRALCPNVRNWYCGTLLENAECSVGIYLYSTGRAREICVGGRENTKTKSAQMSLLVHWNKSSRQTEMAAQTIYRAIENASGITIGDRKVNYIDLHHNAPLDVGADEHGVQERVIKLTIYYERGN